MKKRLMPLFLVLTIVCGILSCFAACGESGGKSPGGNNSGIDVVFNDKWPN